MRILITNDDGILAPGLAAAEDIVRAFAPDAEVWVVAPESEQSGVGHCISYIDPLRLIEHGERRFAVTGSPADCVIMALHHLMVDAPPDLLISGVNRGHNVAEDVVYSGTVGGAMEGVLHGVKAIALSQYYGPANLALKDTFEAARTHGAEVLRRVAALPFDDAAPYGLFYNVNFPPLAASDVKGVAPAVQGRRRAGAFRIEETTAPNRRAYYWLRHGMGNDESAPGSDARDCAEGWVTVTPLRADLTAHDRMADIATGLERDLT